jgi:Ni/Co efflux regulator RcnB
MHIFSKSIIIASLFLGLSFTQTAMAQSIKDIQEYCQSMSGSGMSDEDAKAFIDDCVAEQSAYLEQERVSESNEQYEDNSSYEESNNYEENNSYEDSYQEPQYESEDYGQEQNCYAKVDDHIQKLLDSDPNVAFDYDQLVDQCLKGNL